MRGKLAHNTFVFKKKKFFLEKANSSGTGAYVQLNIEFSSSDQLCGYQSNLFHYALLLHCSLSSCFSYFIVRSPSVVWLEKRVMLVWAKERSQLNYPATLNFSWRRWQLFFYTGTYMHYTYIYYYYNGWMLRYFLHAYNKEDLCYQKLVESGQCQSISCPVPLCNHVDALVFFHFCLFPLLCSIETRIVHNYILAGYLVCFYVYRYFY